MKRSALGGMVVVWSLAGIGCGSSGNGSPEQQISAGTAGQTQAGNAGNGGASAGGRVHQAYF